MKKASDQIVGLTAATLLCASPRALDSSASGLAASIGGSGRAA